MIENTKRFLNLFILLVGLAILVYTIRIAGFTLRAGIVVGLAFMAYGGVRFYYSWGKP